MKQVKKRVLVAPLDWGLGHATRCIPVIKMLLQNNFEVFIAAQNACAQLLKKEFPFLKIVPLPGYNISYSDNKKTFLIKMLSQFPSIKKTIKKENKWLERVRKEYKLDIVISDNRFGLYHPKIHSIFITHQLHIKAGNFFIEWLAQKINYYFINKYNECWIPDEAGLEGLAGELSHPKKMPFTSVKYIGILSRLKKATHKKNIDLLVMLSGPEPQRSIFENILLPQMMPLKISMVLVRGLPAEDNKLAHENNYLNIYNHLPAEELNEIMLSAKTIVARSGYSTIMDLATLQQNAMLVATPGQTEQEYLAAFLSNKNYFISANQQGFNLVQAMNDVAKANMEPFKKTDQLLLQKAILTLQ